MVIYNEKDFSKYFDDVFKEALRPKLKRIGELMVEKTKQTLRQNLGKETTLSETLKYKIDGLDVIIYSNDDILAYINYGTKPHIIKAKNGKALSFGWPNHPTGMKPSASGKFVFREVHHPGTKARPFLSQALFLAKNEIIEILQE